MKYLSMLLALVCVTLNAQTRKYYYDRDWHAIDDELFATYYVAAKVDVNSPINIFRAFDRNGQILIDGKYSHLDTLSFFNSIFDGEWISYHKNGNVKINTTYHNGLENGEHIEYYDDKRTFVNGVKIDGQWHGIYESFMPNGDHIVIKYDHGTAVDDKLTLINKFGGSSAYHVSDGTLITSNPCIDSLYVDVFEDLEWYTYDINGFTLSVHMSKTRDYGKYYRCDMYLLNHSNEPVYIDNKQCIAYVDKAGDSHDKLLIYSAKEYSEIVQRKQNVALVISAIGAGVASGMSAYSTSYSTIHSGGVLYSSVTTTYNPAYAYGAYLASSYYLASISKNMKDEQEAKKIGYLEPTTINPGEAINSYFHIEYKKGDQLSLIFIIGDEKYLFPIAINKL
ncbi:MAG: hypothetical protein MJZ27_09115 [Bacteroidales bacterium]|nr:hypothetical protein [Bacteroidales bacterium]